VYQKRNIAYLYELVPTGADNDWVLWVGAESDAGNPIGVSLLGDGELAVTKSVPQLDCSVAGSRDNLSVVGREGDGEDVVVVSNESAGGGTGSKLPKAESLVPGSRKSVGTVGGDHLELSLSIQLQIALNNPAAPESIG
jgi:hypothetical protein